MKTQEAEDEMEKLGEDMKKIENGRVSDIEVVKGHKYIILKGMLQTLEYTAGLHMNYTY